MTRSKCYYPDWEGGLEVGKHSWNRTGFCGTCGEPITLPELYAQADMLISRIIVNELAGIQCDSQREMLRDTRIQIERFYDTHDLVGNVLE